MSKRTIISSLLTLVLSASIFCGCSGDKSTPDHSGPPRDNTPKVLVPEATGSLTYGNESVSIDASNTSEGYLMVQYTGTCPKVKLQIKSPDQTDYTYMLSAAGTYETFPLSSGNGTYSIQVLENISDDMYAVAFTQDVSAEISDEFKPFLYPNQYVSFDAESQTVKKGQELASDTYSDLEVVQNIYHYVIKNISYDTKKAQDVTYGYLPNVDSTLDSGTGICFDYASVMAAMLRSQGIPTKLEVGYSGDALHSWISTYVDDIGWVDNVIEFDGTSWELLDPTLAAGNNEKEVKKYVGDGSNYTLKYSY